MFRWVAGLTGLALVFWAVPVWAYDPREEFQRGTVVVTPQVGGGNAHNISNRRVFSDLSFVNGAVRVSLLPLDPLGQRFLTGALEVGLEPFFQYFTDVDATAEGAKVGARYHFLGASPIFPYVEGLAGIGASSLNVSEVDSNHLFFLEGGVGLSYFVKEGVALTTGYRFQHMSNGGTEDPNQDVNSSTGVLGVSFFFH
ncbi:MAG: acyloxyacyl hydrolase [Candidatus Methylomirabilia bacterium]